VALGIAAAQGCQGPQRGLGGDGDVVRQPQEHLESGYQPMDGDSMSDQYESTFDISE
jgi:hypothetical protein